MRRVLPGYLENGNPPCPKRGIRRNKDETFFEIAHFPACQTPRAGESGKCKGSFGPSAVSGLNGAATFSALIPSDGTYKVFSYQHLPREEYAPVTVISFSNGETVKVNAADVKVVGQTSSAWHPVGEFSLASGETFSAKVTAEGDGLGCADAILLVKE